MAKSRYGPNGLNLKPLRKPPKPKNDPHPVDIDFGAPTVSISSERLKEVEDWKNGEKYILEAEQVGQRMTDERGNKRTVVELKVLKAGPAGKKK